ncbi:MAG TPA: divalent metal cation transporter [Acidiphilium sp.]|uniref:NRAMP family divalent metal transporter n=1 Tax=unclassified Acidiphilium TaxID=2617493 RepID=UPI0025C054FD|nr:MULTISPECIES: divalent metal cation transporter [unclassified Acidiphilium]HQT60372.1 divalent metal cation transporter [Acidiphilium sp.]HQU10019.1 divalent metal cation transporter [Acidiphilium sp.]
MSPRSRRSRLPFLAVLGPGIVVMLADTEVGSIITASQSGVAWGYRLLLLQFILIPILYVVQELTVRLGIFTGKGHGELIRDTFGKGWAWLSAAGLAVATIGALLSEFSGVAGVGELYGIPRAMTLTLSVVFLLVVAFTGSYRRVERVAIGLGLFELVFFVIAFVSRPDAGQIAAQTFQPALGNPGYLYLVAANIGAVIMPWMIFYQQSAVADKRLTPADFKYARWDTAIGSIVTQLVMAAVLISTAATIGRHNPNASLNTVGDITAALTPYLGVAMGKLVFGAGVLGAGLVAAIVASLALAWGLGEVAGYRRSLEDHPLRARWFYGVYAACLILGAVLVGVVPNLVILNIAVEVMNALLLPLVLGFLVMLGIKALPPQVRLRGWYAGLAIAMSVLTAGLGVYGGLSGAGLF